MTMPEYPARAKFSDGLKRICRRRGRLKTQLQPSYTPFRQKNALRRPNRIRVFQTASVRFADAKGRLKNIRSTPATQ